MTETLHGVDIVDPYRWLETQDSSETRAWISAQNAYAHSMLDDIPIRERIHNRLSELMRIDKLSAPVQRGNRFFLARKRAEDELWTVYFREGLDGEDLVLLDPHPWSSDQTTDVTFEDASSDGRFLVYGIRTGGEDETELRVMDVDARADLPDRLPRDLYRGVSWAKGTHDGFYYALQDREHGTRIRFHHLGSAQAADPEVFGEGYGRDTWIWPDVSPDGRYLLIGTSKGWQSSEIFIQDLSRGTPIQPLVSGIDAHFYGAFAGDKVVVQTDWNAPNYRICVVDLNDPGTSPDDWREVVSQGHDPIEGFTLAGGKLFVRSLHNITSVIRTYTLDGEQVGEIPVPTLGTADGPWGQWDSDHAFVFFTSYTYPLTCQHYEVSTERLTLWAHDGAPFDSEAFEVSQVWYASKDGTRIPMCIAHRKGLEPNGASPTLLYGYGGFGVSLTPFFGAQWAAWLDQRGVLAVPNLRGGGEFGEAWHRAGMLENKQNVFDDFIAAAEWLIENGYTNPSKLAIQGGSNGGLLVCAALTQRPDLFQAVLCEAPDLDMLGYPRFVLSPPAMLEYGDATNPEHFKFLVDWSPYHKVTPGTRYPAVLLLTGDADTRVPPLQARKMTARLQAATSSGRPVLLLYEPKTGHAGGRPIRKTLEDWSLELAFLSWQLEIETP